MRPALRTLALSLPLLVGAAGIPQSAISYSPPVPPQSPPRIVRSESGTRGVQQGGMYVIEDPRTSFHYPEDDRVIVSFEWEGAPGRHHFEGRWKNPQGKVVVISDLEYDAMGNRFGAYWTLTLNDSVKTGLWALEAYIDGQLAGMHAFQILSESDGDLMAATTRRLTPSEIYRDAAAAAVVIRKFDAQGELLGSGAGFFIGPNVVLTAFQVINDASSLEMIVSDGRRSPVAEIVTWNRNRNWAFLKAPVEAPNSLSFARDNSSAVGDRCFTLSTAMGGSCVIQEARIVGRQKSPDFGERLNLDIGSDWTAVGAPVLDERGEVIGVLVMGDLFPGMPFRQRTGLSTFPSNLLHLGYPSTASVLPFTVIKMPRPGAPTIGLGALRAKEQFLPSLVPNEHLVGGTIAHRLEERKKQKPEVIGEAFEFSRADAEIVLMVNWNPLDKARHTLQLRVYDIDNKLRVQSKVTKHKLKAYVNKQNWWTIEISRLPIGVYRADVLADERPVFRSFFKLIE